MPKFEKFQLKQNSENRKKVKEQESEIVTCQSATSVHFRSVCFVSIGSEFFSLVSLTGPLIGRNGFLQWRSETEVHALNPLAPSIALAVYSGVTRKSGAPGQISKSSPPSPFPYPLSVSYTHLTLPTIYSV